MSLIVVDASAVAAWALPSQASPSARALLQDAHQHRFMAPHIFPIEVRSLLLAAERRGRWWVENTETVLNELEALEIRIVRMDRDPDLSAVMTAARASGLSLYDAFYLKLAESDGAMLASRDKPLLAAAARRAISIMDLNL